MFVEELLSLNLFDLIETSDSFESGLFKVTVFSQYLAGYAISSVEVSAASMLLMRLHFKHRAAF